MSGGIFARGDVKEASLEARVIRADGTVEDLGVVSYWHRNPIRRWWWHFRRALSGRA